MFFPQLFKRCPKTGRIRGINKQAWPAWTLLFSGIAATIWYLVRVIPKPSRANYPCLQATSPIRLGFLAYIVALAGSVLSFRKASAFFRNSKYFFATLFLILSGVFLMAFIAGDAKPASAAPTGTGKGIYPGRVTWVYNPNAAKWTGTGNYWDAAVNPQAEYDKAFTAGIVNLSGGTTDADSWDKIFKWFNNSHGRTGTGYQSGDKIAIKINQNNAINQGSTADNQSNANPQTCVAILKSLVAAGVPQADIWIGDPSRVVTDNIVNAIKAACPNVNVVDHFGGTNRVTSSTVANAFPNTDVATGEISCFYNARYIICQPLLKGHSGQVITFGAKNFYGITGISNLWQDNNRHPGDNALTAFMTNANFGGKVVLWCMDAMYPNPNLDGTPSNGTAIAPFSGKQMSSFIMSLDGVAEECVSYDFWSSIYNQTGGTNYMVNAANAGVGVYEHWNNATARQYTRNLNPTANGIELVSVNPTINITRTTLPATIQAEDYNVGIEGVAYHDADAANTGGVYRTDGVDIQACTDAGAGYNVGWINAGEWLAYNIKVPAAGSYSFTARVASATAGTKTLKIQIDGADVANGSVNFTTANGWQSWADAVSGTFTLPAGDHELRVYMVTGNFNFNYITFTSMVPPNAPPTVSITSPANNAHFSTSPVDITMLANATDSDGSVSRVDFYNGTTLAGTVTSAPYQFTFAAIPNGAYTLKAIATDDKGASTTASITTSVGNYPPTVSITSPANNASFTAPATVIVNASAQDADGSIAQVELFNGTTSLGVVTAAPFSWTLSGLAVGAYTLKAIATDDKGATANASIAVTVNPAGPLELAQGKVVTASSTEKAGTEPGLAVDGVSTTRWSSAFSDPQWIMVDLGALYAVSRVTLSWEAASAKDYQIQLSTNNSTWTTAITKTGMATGARTDDITAITGNARYVRIYGTARNTAYGYSLYEIKVYGTPANAAPTVAITSPANQANFSAIPSDVNVTAVASDADGSIAKVEFYNGTTLAGTVNAAPYSWTFASLAQGSYTLKARAYDDKGATSDALVNVTVGTVTPVEIGKGKTIVASSEETNNGTLLKATNANDGNTATRWSSLFADPQWIRIDLGATYLISQVTLTWEAASAKNYTIDVSSDGSTWSTISTKTNMATGARTDDITGLSGSGRYIRMNGTARNTTYGYSLFEFKVYGTPAVVGSAAPMTTDVLTQKRGVAEYKLDITSVHAHEIGFTLPAQGSYELSLYSPAGVMVKYVVSFGAMGPNALAANLPSGMYLLTLKTQSGSIRKMMRILQ